jgi:hypothetical protein
MLRTFMAAMVLLGAQTLVCARSAADDNPAKACLEQCKVQTEQCVQAAGDDEAKQGECASDALSCIQRCET